MGRAATLLVVVVAVFSVVFVDAVYGLTFEVKPTVERCVQQEFEAGRTIHLFFDVVEGGFLDIDVRISAPDLTQLYSVERESEGSATLMAPQTGRYEFCFSNHMSTLTSKVVSFDISEGVKLEDVVAHPDHVTPVEHSVLQLSEGLHQLQEDVRGYRKREESHRDTTEAVLERIRLWGIAEAFFLIGVVVAQLYVLKRFFEVKRVA